MKKLMSLILAVSFFSCANNSGNDTASPGTLKTNDAGSTIDTNRLITDSVLMQDSNTSDIDAMKKIN